MNKKNSPQRKTTLKWNSNGELSEIDMLRILEKISSNDLSQCFFTIPYRFYFRKLVFRTPTFF